MNLNINGSDVTPNLGYNASIPGYIFYSQAIGMGEKFLYGLLTNLATYKGYCWATNDFLAQSLNVDSRTIQRWLAALKKNKFIIIDTGMNGFKRWRHIWLSSDARKHSIDSDNPVCDCSGTKQIQKSYSNDKNVVTDNDNLSCRVPPSPYIQTNISTSLKRCSKPPKRRPPPLIVFNAEQRKFDGITDEDIKAWKEKFPALDVPKEIGECAEWAIYNIRKNYRKSILTWFKNCSKNVQKSEDTSNSDKALAEKIYNFFKKHQRSDIELGYKYLEFKNGPSVVNVEFGDKEFRNICDRELRKRKLNL
jgi:hypothetical protein